MRSWLNSPVLRSCFLFLPLQAACKCSGLSSGLSAWPCTWTRFLKPGTTKVACLRMVMFGWATMIACLGRARYTKSTNKIATWFGWRHRCTLLNFGEGRSYHPRSIDEWTELLANAFSQQWTPQSEATEAPEASTHTCAAQHGPTRTWPAVKWNENIDLIWSLFILCC